MNRSLVTIATLNEADNLETLVSEVFANAPESDILIIDDNSSDGTSEIAFEASARDKRVHLLQRRMREGLAAALMAGFQWAWNRSYERVINIDGDLSHNPVDITRLIAHSANDLTIGSRYLQRMSLGTWSLSRRILSLAGRSYFNHFCRLNLTDPSSGFRCFSRRALSTIVNHRFCSIGFAFHAETAYYIESAGLRTGEVPINFRARLKGKSKLTTFISFEREQRTGKEKR